MARTKKATTAGTVATAETVATETIMSFNDIVKQGYAVALEVNKGENNLAQWCYNAIITPMTKEQRETLNKDVKGWYSESFAKHVNGALNIAYKLDVINNSDMRLNLYLKKSFNDLYRQLREWKKGGTETAGTTAKNKKGNSTKETAESGDGSILAQCLLTADNGFSDVTASLILFGKLINDLQQELTPEMNARIITAIDELSDMVLKGE